MELARHVQSTQIRKLVIFLPDPQKKILVKFFFLHADEHESFLQTDTNILGVWLDLVKVLIILPLGLTS